MKWSPRTPSTTSQNPPAPSTKSASLHTYYPDGDPPLLAVEVTARRSRAMLGLVDSGAFRTILPKAIAGELGITDADLEQDDEGGIGVGGGEFDTWSSLIPITGQVVRVDPQTGDPELWGPIFDLDPAFSEDDAFIWGREDFFEAFAITFEPGSPPSFVLED
jgi:hypothetical protein